MDIEEALYTTRAMRRVRPDPIPMDIQARILDAAVRAPSGGNAQNWKFLLVDDKDVIGRIAPLYRDAIDQLWKTIYAGRIAAAEAEPDLEESRQMKRVQSSAQWLADHFEEVPLFLFAFIEADPSGGSIYPAVWSAPVGGPGPWHRKFTHCGAEPLVSDRGLRDSRRADRPELDHGLLRQLRLPNRAVGRGRTTAGPGRLLPQPLGHPGGLQCRRTPLETGRVTTGDPGPCILGGTFSAPLERMRL